MTISVSRFDVRAPIEHKLHERRGTRVERFGQGKTVSFELLLISKFCQNSIGNHQNHVRLLSEFIRNPDISRVLDTLIRIWRKSGNFSSTPVQHSMKIVEKMKTLRNNLKIAKLLTKFAKILNLEQCKGMIFL